MDAKGNVVAMAITAIIITVGAAAFIVTFYGTQPPTLPITTALSETKISVNKAIALSISDWAETGFDQEQPMWYNNGNFPASLEEAQQSLRDTVKTEITDVLNELEAQRGYTYEFDDSATGPVLEFDFDGVATMDGLNQESLTVTVSGFKIKDEEGNIVTVKEFETEEKFDYPVWDLYNELYEWAEDDMGGISTNLQLLIDSAPYQMQLCDCGIISKTTEDAVILSGSTTWDDRTDPDTGAVIQGVESFVLAPALESLKTRFADNPDIICSYVVEDKAIENIPNIIKRGQAGCECAGGIGLENNETLLASAAGAWRTDEIGKPELYYGVADSSGAMRETVTPHSGFPIVESFLRIERTTPIPELTYSNCSDFAAIGPQAEELCNQGRICFHTDEACKLQYSGESYVEVTGDNEAIGMTRRIAALVRFKCEDVTSRVGTEDEFKNLSAEVVVRFGILKGSEPPEFCTTESGPICEWGAVVVIIGYECTPWDDCYLDSDDDAACGICECMVGSQIIDPMGDAIGAALKARHDGDETFSCLDPADPACAWCHSKGGLFKCPSQEEFDGTTAECQALINEAASSADRSEQCLLYTCEVEGDTVMRGCVWQPFPTPCDSCRRCEEGGTGRCIPDDAKVGETCVPSPRPTGADQKCYKCTLEGDCIVNAEAIGTALCSNSYGCYTYCNNDGTCSYVEAGDVGMDCPVGKDNYECRECGIRNGKLYCGDICDNGCCADRSMNWGRCINPDGKCCPETMTLTDCPAST